MTLVAMYREKFLRVADASVLVYLKSSRQEDEREALDAALF